MFQTWKTSQVHAKVLQQLFPSSSSKRPKLSNVFDPKQSCVAAPKQRTKAAHCKPSNITLFLTEDKRRVVPKAIYRTALTDNGRIKKADFRRVMSSSEVSTVIETTFRNFSLAHPIFLKCDDGNTQCLVEDDNQHPDGNQLIDYCHPRKAALYIVAGSTYCKYNFNFHV